MVVDLLVATNQALKGQGCLGPTAQGEDQRDRCHSLSGGLCRDACSFLRAVALGRASVQVDLFSAKPGKQEMAVLGL